MRWERAKGWRGRRDGEEERVGYLGGKQRMGGGMRKKEAIEEWRRGG